MPACISPTVTAEGCRSESSTSCSQATTFGFGRGLRSSETMSVSSKYTAALKARESNVSDAAHGALPSARRARSPSAATPSTRAATSGRAASTPAWAPVHQYRSLFSAARDDLGSFADTRLEELAEASFSILYRPILCLHASEHMTSLLTSHKRDKEGRSRREKMRGPRLW